LAHRLVLTIVTGFVEDECYTAADPIRMRVARNNPPRRNIASDLESIDTTARKEF
jgi:hypothetical protein